jgi:hypothetical protein
MMAASSDMTSKVVRSAFAGVFAGALATALVSAVLFAGRRLGLYSAYPPEAVVKEATDPEGPLPTLEDDQQENVWPLVHFVLGAAFGAFYGVSRGLLPGGMRTPLAGAALGRGVWLVNYGRVAPGLGLLPRAPRDDSGRQLTNAVAHAIYGATLVALLERGEQRNR